MEKKCNITKKKKTIKIKEDVKPNHWHCNYWPKTIHPFCFSYLFTFTPPISLILSEKPLMF